jgi:hypothetical protein
MDINGRDQTRRRAAAPRTRDTPAIRHAPTRNVHNHILSYITYVAIRTVAYHVAAIFGEGRRLLACVEYFEVQESIWLCDNGVSKSS